MCLCVKNTLIKNTSFRGFGFSVGEFSFFGLRFRLDEVEKQKTHSDYDCNKYDLQ